MAIFYMNGGSASSDRGWCGWTGSTNYVVCYPFTTGASGASNVSISLSNIWTQKGNGGQSWGFKIGTSAAEYANAHGITPDSNTTSLSYAGIGWNGTLSATVNLEANKTYYLFVYVVSGGTEYYQGWNLTAPNITTSGSYTPPESTLKSISSTVTTGEKLTIVMDNPNNLTHTVVFSYGSTTLATTTFTTTLSYVCPRSWFSANISVTEMSVAVKITSSNGGVTSRSFILYSDAGMVPVLSASSISFTASNGGSAFTKFIATVSRAYYQFADNAIDMSATAGAEIRSYQVSVNNKIYSTKSATTGVLPQTCTARCTVTDSRGRTGSVDITISMESYTLPSLNNMDVYRCNADGSASENGAYISAYAEALCSPITEGDLTNTATITVSYRPEGTDGWRLLGGLTPGDPALFNMGDTINAISVRLIVWDSLNKNQGYEFQLAFEKWMLCFKPNGDGAAIGMSASVSDQLTIPSGWAFASGAAKFSNDRIVLVEGKHYGTGEPGDTVSNPQTGQIYFKVI